MQTSFVGRALRTLAMPVLAVALALGIGALIIAASGKDPIGAYSGLATGAWGSSKAIADTLVSTTPYLFAGLAVALAFKGGLFNIGGEGQLALGAVTSAVIGYKLNLPALIHLPLALLAGALAGGMWGGIAGLLKARTGAHEVITTIMLNYMAINIAGYLLNGPLREPPPNAIARTPIIARTAHLPALIPGQDVYPDASSAPQIIHWGVLLGVVAVVAISFFLYRTVWGFKTLTVGATPAAAEYAGIRVGWVLTLIMAASGALAGLAGAIQVTAVNYRATLGFNIGYGFDAIAIALLGKNNPYGVLVAALLFASLRTGASSMQFFSGVSADIISVIQALILIFIAADRLLRPLFRGRASAAEGQATLTRGWGK